MARREEQKTQSRLYDIIDTDAYDSPLSSPQALPLPCPCPGMHFIIDFDKTITKQDTTLDIGEIALSYKLTTLNRDQRGEWNSFLQWYANTLSSYTDSYMPKPSTLKEEIIWLRSLRRIEEQCHRCSSLKKILKDVPTEVYRGAAYDLTQKIPWRESFFNLMTEATFSEICRTTENPITGEEVGDCMLEKKHGIAASTVKPFTPSPVADLIPRGEKLLLLNILSVSWSEDFIRGFLAGMLDELEKRTTRSPRKSTRGLDAARKWPIQIWANRIDPDTGMIMPGTYEGFPKDEAIRVLSSCEDKLKVMTAKMVQYGMKTVYVGDSTTDLECLLGAHIGVVMTDGGGGGSLMERLRTIGYPCDRLSERRSGYEESGLPRKLWWVNDFLELVPLMREASMPVKR